MILKVLKFSSIRFWRKLVNVLFLLFVVFLVFGAQIHHKNQKIKNLEVFIDTSIGDNFLAPSDIKNHIVLKYDSVVGKTVGDLNLNEIENIVLNITGVAKADVYINASGVLQVSVLQKKAICRVLTSDGKGYYLDDKGFTMPWVSVYTPNVMLCTGFIDKYGKGLDSLKKNTDLNKGIFELYQLLSNNQFIKQMISYLYIDNRGNIWLHPVIGNHKFNWGKLDDLEVKIKKTETFYNKIIPVKGWDVYKEIDLRYNQQIVCK